MGVKGTADGLMPLWRGPDGTDKVDDKVEDKVFARESTPEMFGVGVRPIERS